MDDRETKHTGKKKNAKKRRQNNVQDELLAVESLFFSPGLNCIVSMPPAPDSYPSIVPKTGIPSNFSEKQVSLDIDSISTDDSKARSTNLKAFASDDRNECYQNYKGVCNTGCELMHTFRPPKQLIVCASYADLGGCNNKRSCRFMHEDFPCKYYYLGVSHPDNATDCIYSHGEPLDSEVIRSLLGEAHRTRIIGPDSTYDRVKWRFKLRNRELQRSYGMDVKPRSKIELSESPTAVNAAECDSDSKPNALEQPSLCSVYTDQQNKAAIMDNTALQHQLLTQSVAEQRARGLSVDQIFQMYMKAAKLSAFSSSPSEGELNIPESKEQISDETISEIDCKMTSTSNDEMCKHKNLSQHSVNSSDSMVMPETLDKVNIQWTSRSENDELPARWPLFSSTTGSTTQTTPQKSNVKKRNIDTSSDDESALIIDE